MTKAEEADNVDLRVCVGWTAVSTAYPEAEGKVLALSPDYPPTSELRFRVMDARFVKHCDEVVYWLYAESLTPL